MPAQFFRMTPLAFYRFVEGYKQRSWDEIHRWRTSFAQFFNANRGENQAALSPQEVHPLPFDEERTRARRSHKTISKKAYEALYARFNPPS